MKFQSLIICCLIWTTSSFGQDLGFKVGEFQVGTKISQNVLQPENYDGFAVGLKGRYFMMSYLAFEINTEFATLDLSGTGSEASKQFGISTLYYPLKDKVGLPYLFAGYNYNLMTVTPVSYIYIDRTEDIIIGNMSRLYFGVGSDFYYFGDYLNLGLALQYDYPLNDPLRFEIEESPFGKYLNTNPIESIIIDPVKYLNITVSLNYTITDFKK